MALYIKTPTYTVYQRRVPLIKLKDEQKALSMNIKTGNLEFTFIKRKPTNEVQRMLYEITLAEEHKLYATDDQLFLCSDFSYLPVGSLTPYSTELKSIVYDFLLVTDVQESTKPNRCTFTSSANDNCLVGGWTRPNAAIGIPKLFVVAKGDTCSEIQI
jgi:hypothetical protein